MRQAAFRVSPDILRMEICEQRDPAFWRAVAEHPEVSPSVLFGHDAEVMDAIVANPGVLPLASENGGFLFTSRDNFGRVFELHTMFRPNGWGREVALALKQALERVFNGGADLVFTHSNEDAWRTKPPLSFGFKRLGEPFDTEWGRFCTWGVFANQWSQSPARTRWLGV